MITLGIMGAGRSGKDEAAEYLTRHTSLRYNGPTSIIISKEVARREGVSLEEAHDQRHARRAYWRSLGDEMRLCDKAALARAILIGSNLLVGVRSRSELEQVQAEGLCDLIVWIDRKVPHDPTLEFGPELCDVVIQNYWGLAEYHEKLYKLAKVLKIVS